MRAYIVPSTRPTVHVWGLVNNQGMFKSCCGKYRHFSSLDKNVKGIQVCQRCDRATFDIKLDKPRYRYWESPNHPDIAKAWRLVGGVNEYVRRVRLKRQTPIVIIIEHASAPPPDSNLVE